MASFSTTLGSAWDHSGYTVLSSGQLQSANSDQTEDLLQPNYYQYNVLAELNSLQAMGVKSVTIHINFPAMYQPFYTDPSDYQAYLAFYTQLVSEIRSRGLKLIIQNTTAVVYPGNNSTEVTPYYQSLDWTAYQTQRAQLAASLAQLFQPDYLILVDEPDTEATGTGQPNAATVNGSTSMVQQMISGISAAGVTGVQLGAGCGTWDPSFPQFIESFASLPLNVIDMHIYPVNLSNLPDALAAVGTIQASGKQPSMSEYWSYKETDAEYNEHLSNTVIYARDAFSFWSPIDITFLQLMSEFGNYGHFAFMTPFWTHYFAAYLDYNTYGALPDATVITDSDTASANAESVGAFTVAGLAYENTLITAPDQKAPAVPAAPTAIAYSQTAANIAWTPTHDNIGVAAYDVYRDGQLMQTINGPFTYSDLTLSPNTTYSYTIDAFDAQGNHSAPSDPLSITTYAPPDTTPPSVPAGVQATGVADTQIRLTWQPSTDNVAVMGYEIYRGTSPDNIAPFASVATPGFTDSSMAPLKTFYYQVDAYDTSGNHSARSAIVSGSSLPDVTPPTVPGNVAVSAQPGPVITVTWSASTDDFMVAGYEIFRSQSSGTPILIGWSAAPQLSFADTNAISGFTYSYSVAAMDPSMNLSPLSAPVTVTAP